jgi:hypothetical protein
MKSIRSGGKILSRHSPQFFLHFVFRDFSFPVTIGALLTRDKVETSVSVIQLVYHENNESQFSVGYSLDGRLFFNRPQRGHSLRLAG